MWIEAIVAALGAAIYPPALLLVAYLLANPHPRKRAVVVLAGAALATLGAGFTVVVLLHSTGQQNRAHRSVPPWVDIALGGLLVLFAVVVVRRPPRGPKTAATQQRQPGLPGLFLVGCVMYSPTPLYLTSLRLVSQTGTGIVATVLGVVLVAGTYMALLEVPLVLHARWPEPTVRWTSTTNAWLARHGRTVIVVVAGGFGIYLLGAGIGHLPG